MSEQCLNCGEILGDANTGIYECSNCGMMIGKSSYDTIFLQLHETAALRAELEAAKAEALRYKDLFEFVIGDVETLRDEIGEDYLISGWGEPYARIAAKLHKRANDLFVCAITYSIS